MDSKIIQEARRFLGIDEYPGNLFNLFRDTEKMIKENKVILFKEDIDNLSGFIGYNSGYTIICINNKRNIGHQNFTLAHELGHKFLHIGVSKCDANPEGGRGDKEEREANCFAKELLYPIKCVEKDIDYVNRENLLLEENWSKLAEYINILCCRYCTSFSFTFNRLLENKFKNYKESNSFYRKFKNKEIGKFDDRFPDRAFVYNVKEGHEFYKSYYGPYDYMKKLVNSLVDECELGAETGAAMVERYRDLEG